jgi:hypothetical protein
MAKSDISHAVIFMYLVLGSTSFVFSCLVFILTLLLKELRRPPGWLLFW